MNTDVKSIWTAALRSGEFVQGQRELLTGSGQYCCLGVLCELYRRQTGLGEWKVSGSEIGSDSVIVSRRIFVIRQDKTIDQSWTSLPDPVRDWAWLRSCSPAVQLPRDAIRKTLTCQPHLTELNDSGVSFGEIADLIETSL